MSAQPAQRTYTAASIAAACAAIIASNSPQQQRQTFARVNAAPSPKATGATSKKVEALKPRTVAVMTVHAQTMEEQMREMMRKLEQVTKDNEEQNKKIDELQREVVALGKQKVGEAGPAIEANAVEEANDETVKSNQTTAVAFSGADEDESDLPPQASSFFDRIHPPTKRENLPPRKHSSVFRRLGAQDANRDTAAPQNRGHRSRKRPKLSKGSVFNRLGAALKVRKRKKSLKRPIVTPRKMGSKFTSKWYDPCKSASKATKNDNLKTPASARKTHAHS